jgi:riboflavin synthase
MFTGLVEAIGVLTAKERRGPGARLTIRCPFDPIVMGESIACDGVCLTVDAIEGDRFVADASAETLARTTLGSLAVGAELHLERALAMGQRFGGHIVSGHVDGVAELVRQEPLGEAVRLHFRVPAPLLPYVTEKGSITLAGVSLTVNSVEGDMLSLVVVPRTQRWTKLAKAHVGDRFNVEVDVLARYVERLLHQKDEAPGQAAASSDDAWLSRLGKAGYL